MPSYNTQLSQCRCELPLESLFAAHVSDGVGQDTGVKRESPRPFHRSEVIALLSPDNEVGSNGIDLEQSLEVVVSSFEDVE